MDPSRAPVAFGRLAVPQLFAELQQPEEEGRLPALASLCDLLHDPELIQQTITGGTAPGITGFLFTPVRRMPLSSLIHSSEEII